MWLREKIKVFVSTEIYLLKLIMKLNGWAGIVVLLITLFNNIYPIVATYIGALIIDELVELSQLEQFNVRIYYYILAELGLKVFSVTLSSIESVIESHIENKASQYLDIQIIRKISEMDCAYFEDPKNLETISIAEASKNEVAEEIYGSRNLISSIVAFALSITAFLSQSPLLGIIFLATYIPGIIMEQKVRESTYNFTIQNIPETREKDYYRSILTSKSTAKDVRLYGLHSYLKDKYNQLWKRIKTERFKLFKTNSLKSFGTILVKYAGTVAIILYSVISIVNNHMSLGQMSWYIGISVIVGVNYESVVSSIVRQIKYIVPHVNLFMHFMSYKNNMEYGERICNYKVPQIKFENVTFYYPNSDTPALKNVSFCLAPGEKIGIVGINGAGKTTLIKLLLRLYEPQSGCIYVDGCPLSDLSKEEYRKLFCVCFQNVNTYALSLRDNIALSDIDRVNNDNEISDAIRAVGADFIDELGKGYDTVLSRNIDENGYEPSGGQWQKIAMARAFFSKAPIVILDEPSSALDPISEDRIFKSFKQLCDQRSGILISHRLSSALIVDRIMLIEGGKIVEIGNHEELMKNKGRYAELFNMQAGKYKRR